MSDVRAVIFDLDGVLVSTDELHFRAWSAIADREGIPFTRQDNERLRGVGRMESLSILLERAPADAGYTPEQRERLATDKNDLYRASLARLGPADALPGAREILEALRARGVKSAVGSSSRNARLIIERLELGPLLDAIVDGNDAPRSKPDPAVFLLAAARLVESPDACIVVEDAESGVAAGLAAGMRVVGVGERTRSAGAHRVADSLAAVTPAMLLHWP